MANTSVCNDTTEALELYEPQGLFLKPVAKINICAQLPQLKTPGKTISNWEVMEKVKNMIRPENFLSIKVCCGGFCFVLFKILMTSIHINDVRFTLTQEHCILNAT